MINPLAADLMLEFAENSGLAGGHAPRRYLWTDAFAVCNFLGLYRSSGEKRYLELARKLVSDVHHVLGKFRPDDTRRGWISGLAEADGELHPTQGGLRIGKELKERPPDATYDPQLEWSRDGQYFHYLTKWVHALCRIGSETRDPRYSRWAAELAVAAHQGFTRQQFPGGALRVVWKMSTDLSRPLVSSTGQHDTLDGLVTCLELQSHPQAGSASDVGLQNAVIDLTEMCRSGRWATEDPLGIGGLLETASRLVRLVFHEGIERRNLLRQVLGDAEESLSEFSGSVLLELPVERRLAFRELGLSIGLHAMSEVRQIVTTDRDIAVIVERILGYEPIATQIEDYWCQPRQRKAPTWTSHRDINAVMLATSLAPEGYLGI